MKFLNKQRWSILKFYVIGWTLSFIFLAIVRGVGTEELGKLQFDFKSSILISLTIGPILGLISGYAQILTEERIYKRISIQRLLILRLVYAVLFLVLTVFIAYLIYQLYFGTEVNIYEFAIDEGSGAIYFYIIAVDLFIAIFRQINLMLGENNLSKLLRGKFYTPREEERVFMFLDLKSSTTIAEKLGHIKYSELIQDCFDDLGVVVKNEAEIYQYVGDEAILTWELNSGLRNANCIEAYFNFKRQLDGKKNYYLAKYGWHPFFKAGVHAGKVTVTEVGRYKKEIAYHGDTINTAARIQGKCNDFNQRLLISNHLKDDVNSDTFNFEKLGSIELRGKTEQVLIYGIKSSA